MERAIGHLSQIPPGEGRNFVVDELRVAVFHTRDGRLFATQAECPHKGGPLADGLTDDASVVCPLHDRAFDFRTGASSDCSVTVYPIRASEHGIIMLTLAED